MILLNVFLGFVVVGHVLGLGIASLFYDGNLLNDIQNPDNRPGICRSAFNHAKRSDVCWINYFSN